MKNFFFRLGLGTTDPATYTGFSPTFVIFADETGAAQTAPGITEIVAGSGLYRFQWGVTTGIVFKLDAGSSITVANGRYVVGSIDQNQRIDEFGATTNNFLIPNLGTTLVAIGNTSIAYGGTILQNIVQMGTSLIAIGNTSIAYGGTNSANLINMGTTLVGIGNTAIAYGGTNSQKLTNEGVTLIAIGNTAIAIGTTNFAIGTTNFALGTTSVALGTTAVAGIGYVGTTLIATGATLVAIGNTLVALGTTNIGIGTSLYGLIGTTASLYGDSATDPATLFGFVKRTQEFLEGTQNFNKSSGTWNVYARGGATLIASKTLSNTASLITKT